MIVPFTKINLCLDTFFKRGIKYVDTRYGVYFMTGKQGSGKTYTAIFYAYRQLYGEFKTIKTNIHSLHINGYNIEYFNKIDEIVTDICEHVIYIIDEVSKKYSKESRTDKDFYSWLNQCRKRKRIVILITQEWREVPMWLRRPAKLMYSTTPLPLLNRFGLYKTTISDAENMVFDKDEGDYICPPLYYLVYKRTKSIASMYDTFEPINEL